MKQLSCDQCRAHWDELISKSTFTADNPEMANVKAHLETCAECRKTFDLLSAARREMQAFPAQQAPTSLRANIHSQLTEEPPQYVWLASLAAFFRSPQKVAWAGSAAVAIFLVAFLMRPESQQAVLKDNPKVLSNRDQVTLQNQQHDKEAKTQSPTMPSPKEAPLTKPTKRPKSPTKATAQTPKHTVRHRYPIIKAQPKPTSNAPKIQPETTIAPKPNQKQQPPKQQITKPAPNPAPATSEDTPPTQKEEPKAPVYEHYSAPAAATTQATEDRATAPAPRAYGKSMDSNRGASAPPVVTKGPSGPAGIATVDKQRMQRSSPETFSWHQQITAKSDVEHAAIYATLDQGLSFAKPSEESEDKHLVWEGAMKEGQKFTVALSLRVQNNDESRFIHLSAVDTDNQKVLWTDTFEVKPKAVYR